MKRSSFTAKKIATLAVFTTLSLITFIIENQFPPMFIPGARMGLANIFSFAALIMYSPIEAFLIVAIRCGLGAVYAGNVSALLYSFTGGVIAMEVSSVLMYTLYPRISVTAVSVTAAVCHNVTQNVVFVLMSGTVNMFVNLPYLVLLGIASGAIVGGVVMLVFKKVPKNVFLKALYKKEK
ncbi:MAG: Gx transporter family protein [Clostridia bacterium]|nr:Gx transporter family protein [Clostridia bacterium]